MSMPRGIARSMAAVALGVAALTATTTNNAHASTAAAELSAVVAEQDASSTDLRTKEERDAANRTKEERQSPLRTKEE
jgi:hypothetical protein